MNGDTTRLKLPTAYREAWRYIRNGQFDVALLQFEEALALAQRLHDPCWELFLESNCCEIFIYYKAEMQTGLDRTIRLATRAYKPEYKNCPMRSRIYCNLADVYSDVDWFGYVDDILEMLDYIENDIPMDSDTHLRVRYIRAQMAFELEKYDEAKDHVQRCLPEAHGNYYRMTHAYEILSRVAYAEGDMALALSYTKERERYARMAPILRSIADALMWQAVFARRLGDKGGSQNLLQRGLAEYERYDLPRRLTYYNVLCELHELNGEAEKALTLREQQLEDVTLQTVAAQSYAHLHYCRLLGRMGKPLDEALHNARTIAQQMKKTDLYLERVQRIADGVYYQYEWQKA